MAKQKGLGTTLEVDLEPGGSPVYVSIGQIVSLSGPSQSVRTIDSTNLESTAAEFLATLPEGGELTGQVHLDEGLTGHDQLQELANSPPVVNPSARLTTSGGTTYVFDFVLTSWEVGGFEVDGIVVADFTFQISGTVTVTPAM